MRLQFVALVLGFLCTYVHSECPNACTGSGTCGSRDMCTCFKNFQGNDCSERVCPYGYGIVDSPKGDLNMDNSVANGITVTNYQKFPAGTWEKYNSRAIAQEGHFYAECSNRGLCDRETGLCSCFAGYDGGACDRASCPNKCSGHGTCETISQLASKAGGTLNGIGNGLGSKGAVSYNLWDARSTMGCRCDPWYGDVDCSQRKCKVGVDPLYTNGGTAIYETFVLHAGSANAISNVNSWVQLRFYDKWGESYITERITLTSSSAVATNLQRIVRELPNSAFTSSFQCQTIEADGTSATNLGAVKVDAATAMANGIIVTCRFGIPGSLRLPTVHDSFIADGTNTGISVLAGQTAVSGTTFRGTDIDYFAKAAVAGSGDCKVSSLARDSTTLTTVAACTLSAGQLIKVQDQILRVSSITTTTVTLTYKWMKAAIASSSSTTVFAMDGTHATATQEITAVQPGSNSFTAALRTSGSKVAAGSIIFFENQLLTVTASTDTSITTDRGFMGQAADGAAVSSANADIYVITLPTTNTYQVVSECSGRGTCDTTSGLCTCFNGYENDNCDTQEVLAV